MSDSKVYMFPEQGNNMVSLLAPLLQQRGVDPNVLLAMRDNNGFGGEGGWFIWVIFLFFLMGWGNNGWGGFGNNRENGVGELGNLINNDNGRELLMNAIQGNANAIGQLATNLNCSIDSVKSAINGVMTQIQSVGNQVGQSSLQVINSIQQGNMTLAQQIANCCCENRLAICQQTNTLQSAINSVGVGQERGFANVAYETQRQTCDVRDAIRDNTAQVLAGQRAAELREMQRELADRDRKIAEQAVVINNGHQTAVFSQMIQSATAPIAGAISTLQNDINSVKCKLPETVTLPYSCATAVPTCFATNYGIYGNNSLWG